MAKYALLIVDMQKAYFRVDALAHKQEELVKSTNDIVEISLQYNVPIFVIATKHARDRSTWTLNMKQDHEGYLFEGTVEASLVDGLKLSSPEVITKTRDSAFFETSLAQKLRSNGIEGLILAGVSTHSCIMLTAAEAYALNFKVILAIDTIATHDPTYHGSALGLLKQEYRQEHFSNQQIKAELSKFDSSK